MHLAELTPPEQRVLGCLIEKRWTTPDQYPLSLNGLRLACNQSTNRDPVTSYDEATVREAAQRLCLYGLARLASGHGSRATKYRHLAEEALGLGREELAVLAVLLLRGPQTPGELKARTERLAPLGSLAEVERVLETLTEREYVEADRPSPRSEGGPLRAPARRRGRWRRRDGDAGRAGARRARSPRRAVAGRVARPEDPRGSVPRRRPGTAGDRAPSENGGSGRPGRGARGRGGHAALRARGAARALRVEQPAPGRSSGHANAQ